MSNSNIFLKSGFPRAPLQNGISRYVCQLQRITIKYCKNNGASKGTRDYLENRLLNLARENPGVVVYVKPRRHRMPVLVAEYLNGDRHWLPIGHHSEVEVAKWVGVMLTQNGNSSAMRLRKLWHTDCPSIQGPWTPFTHKNPNTNLVVYPEEKLSEPLDVEQTATEKLIEMFKKQKLQDSQTNELNKN